MYSTYIEIYSILYFHTTVYRTEILPLYQSCTTNCCTQCVCVAFSAHLGFASRRRDPAGLSATWKVVA